MKKKIILAALLIAAGAVAVYRLVNQAPSESLALGRSETSFLCQLPYSRKTGERGHRERIQRV